VPVGDGLIDHRRPGAVDHGEDELLQRGTRSAANRDKARPRCTQARLPRKPSTASEIGPANQHATAPPARRRPRTAGRPAPRRPHLAARSRRRRRARRVQRDPGGKCAGEQAGPAHVVMGGQHRGEQDPSQRDPGAGGQFANRRRPHDRTREEADGHREQEPPGLQERVVASREAERGVRASQTTGASAGVKGRIPAASARPRPVQIWRKRLIMR